MRRNKCIAISGTPHEQQEVKWSRKKWVRFLIVKSHEFISQIFVGLSPRSATLREKIRIMEPNEVPAQIVAAASKNHTGLGPGLLERKSNKHSRAEAQRGKPQTKEFNHGFHGWHG
jgi:hypothetical protein